MTQRTYLEGIKTNCPDCNYTNIGLETYMIYNPPNQKFTDDFVMSEIENEVGFLSCFTYCDNCGKRYNVKVGVKKSILSSVVIVERK